LLRCLALAGKDLENARRVTGLEKME
jgi:hypothetical protein